MVQPPNELKSFIATVRVTQCVSEKRPSIAHFDAFELASADYFGRVAGWNFDVLLTLSQDPFYRHRVHALCEHVSDMKAVILAMDASSATTSRFSIEKFQRAVDYYACHKFPFDPKLKCNTR